MRSFIKIAITMTTVVCLAGAASAGDDKAKPAGGAKEKMPDTKMGAKEKMPEGKMGAKEKMPEGKMGGEMMPMPTAPAEVADAAKMMMGTWKCTGSMFNPKDGSAMKMTSTMNFKLDLDKFWIHGSFMETGKKTGAYKFEMYTTYEPN